MSTRFCVCAAGIVVTVASGLFAPAVAVAQPPCGIDALYLTDAAPDSPISDGQAEMILFVNNVSEQPCTVTPFPDVDLVGPDDPVFGPTYRLPQQPGDLQPLTIEPAQYVSSRLTFLPGPPDGWVPDTIVVTLPGTTESVQMPWLPGVSVLRQDAATHPGTFIGPLEHTG